MAGGKGAEHPGRVRADASAVWANPGELLVAGSLPNVVVSRPVSPPPPGVTPLAPGTGVGELLCWGGATPPDTESVLFQISEEEERQRRVMKKCLCVRGLKNSPFGGAAPQPHKAPHLGGIMYQGTPNGVLSGRPPSPRKRILLSVPSSGEAKILSGPPRRHRAKLGGAKLA